MPHLLPLRLPSIVPAITQTMNDCVSQGVGVELKILQTLLPLVTNYPAMHGQLLATVRTSISLSCCPLLLYLVLMDDEC